MLKRIALWSSKILLMVLVLPDAGIAAQPQRNISSAMGKLPLYFIENRGQVDVRYPYYLHGTNTAVYFGTQGVTFVLSDSSTPNTSVQPVSLMNKPNRQFPLKLRFVNASPDALVAKDQTSAVMSYFLGPQEEWKTGLKTYASLHYKNLWPGIDLIYSGDSAHLKYSFVVQPGADPSNIQLAYTNASGIGISPAGELNISTPLTTLTEKKPFTYQLINGKRVEIASGYDVEKTNDSAVVKFQLGEYDSSRVLIIDPLTLIYAGYIGGSNTDHVFGIAVDSSGNAYVTGQTNSNQASGQNFPDGTDSAGGTGAWDAVPGFDQSHNSGIDAFAIKVNPTGSALVWGTFLGGSGDEIGRAIAVDSTGAAYVTGQTNSSGFPTLTGPDTSHNGGDDVFVTKINTAGTTLGYSGFIGGGSADRGYGIAVNSSNQAFITGETESNQSTFPDGTDSAGGTGAWDAIPGFDQTHNSGVDAFHIRLTAAGAFSFGGYIGGSDADRGRAIAVDSSGNAYVAGFTASDASSENFPDGTNDAGGVGSWDAITGFDQVQNGSDDAFVIKVASNGLSFSYGTYIGGSSNDSALAIQVDSVFAAYVAGTTNSTQSTFPDGVDSAGGVGAWDATPGFDQTHNGDSDAFVVKLAPNGLSLTYGTFIGGSVNDTGNGLAIDTAGRAYLTGSTQSPQASWPNGSGLAGVTTQKLDTTYGGNTDAYVIKLDFTGTVLEFATYLGGDNIDEGNAIAVDLSGNTYIGGRTNSTATTFPDTVGPDLSQNSNEDGFVAKLSIGITAVKLASFTATQYGPKTLLEWETGNEVSNVGFNIYRQQRGKREKLNQSLIAGTALMSDARNYFGSGQSYAWWDDYQAESGRVEYFLEDIDLNGNKKLHGPFMSTTASGKSPERKQAPLLSGLGRNKTKTETVRVAATTPESAEFADAASGPIENAIALSSPWNLASTTAIKIAVNEERWYRITKTELIAAGLNGNVNPKLIQLYADGSQVPILVKTIKQGKTEILDAIEFYGKPLNTLYSGVRTYWLTAGSTNGLRLATQKGKGSGQALASFPYTAERRERTIYFSGLVNGEEDNFFGALIDNDPVNQEIMLQNIYSGATTDAILEVSIQGVNTTEALNPDHRIQVVLNGTNVGEMEFESRQQHTQQFAVPHSLLLEGSNTVTLYSLHGAQDLNLAHYVRITYQRTFTASSNALWHNVSGGQKVTITGFTDSVVSLIDYTNPLAPYLVSGTIRAVGSTFEFSAIVPGTGVRNLFAFGSSQAGTAAQVVANVPSSWHSGAGNLLMISHESLMSSLAALKTHRETEGYSVSVIDAQDIYDEFNYGAKSPDAIRSFLAYANSNWSQPPVALLLVGDATFDPRNFLGQGDFDLLPIKIVPTSDMETASDDWFSDFDANDVGEIPTGRLPVRTAADASALVNKIVSYGGSVGGWRSQITLVSDNTDDIFNYESISNDLELLVPSSFLVEKISRQQLDSTTARTQLLSAINNGRLLINYVGHGSTEIWAQERLLRSTDAPTFTNNDRLTVLLAMNCLNAFFQDFATFSLAEAMLQAPNGGAVAVFASSGITEPEAQGILNRALFGALFSGQPLTLGEAIRQAKLATEDSDIRKTWVLLGDPLIRVP